MIYLYLFGTCFHFIYVFMIIGNYFNKLWNSLPKIHKGDNTTGLSKKQSAPQKSDSPFYHCLFR